MTDALRERVARIMFGYNTVPTDATDGAAQTHAEIVALIRAERAAVWEEAEMYALEHGFPHTHFRARAEEERRGG